MSPNYRRFISHFRMDIITSIRRLERIKTKIWRQKMFILFYQICLEEMLPKYIYEHIFQTFFFSQAFEIVVDSWKFSMLLLYIVWDDWPIFMISASNEQLQQQFEYILLNPDWHSWWISKMQSGRQDTLEERYAIKFCFKLGKMPQKRMECFRLFSTILHESSISFWVA